MKLACVSVDLDSLHHYARIFGLPADAGGERAIRLIYEVALPRLCALFKARAVGATFFAIGEDLADPSAPPALEKVLEAGFEIGSHSHRHDYALSRAPPEVIEADLRAADAALRAATGVTVRGFRAPGYTLSSSLLRVLEGLGYAYDSSVFPAAPYYLAKAAVMGALRALGRPSGALLDRPAVLLAPRQPYRPSPDEPYREGSLTVLELPISTTPTYRLPLIGALITALPAPVTSLVCKSLNAEPFVNLELHAIDALDVFDGVPEVLAARQRDLSIAVDLKLQRLDSVLEWLTTDRRVVTLAQATDELARMPLGRTSHTA